MEDTRSNKLKNSVPIFKNVLLTPLSRSEDFSRLPSPPSAESHRVDHRHYEPSVDVATVPEREVTRSHISVNMGTPQGRPLDYSVPSHMPLASKNKHGLAAPPMYGHYTEQPYGQWNGTIPTQYPTSTYNHPHRLTAEHGGPHHSHHHGNVSEWSQYPLFSYSCW